jgi:hypothetical protein
MERHLLSKLTVFCFKLQYHRSPSTHPITYYTIPQPQYDIIDSCGHSLPIIDPSKIFKVFLQNPNGLSLRHHNLPLKHDFHLCQDYGTAVLCLPETKVNWNLPHQGQILTSLLHSTWQNTSYSVYKGLEEFVLQCQPGGTAMIACHDWGSRIIKRGEDSVC